MSIDQSFLNAEEALVKSLQSLQSGIDDRTGKGNATENKVEEVLLNPNLPPNFKVCKGAVVSAANPAAQSAAIDRVIYDVSACPPLAFDPSHSIFPIESVSGLVEITMRLDATKLKNDIQHMAPIKAMRERFFLKPVGKTKVQPVKASDCVSPRSYVIGLPADFDWTPKAIATSLQKIQEELGPPTHVHGLYVIGIGYFETIPVETGEEKKYRIQAWTKSDRLFQFNLRFRLNFDRWDSVPNGWAVDLSPYGVSQPEILAD